MTSKYTINLDQVSMDDLLLVGGKNASLGEMIQNLTKEGIKVPGGFAITSSAYWEFLQHNDLEKTIQKLIRSSPRRNLAKRSARARSAVQMTAVRP